MIFGNVFNKRSVAGLIFIAQDQTQVLQGYISQINADGTFLVGANTGTPVNTGFKLVLNDPTGVYGLPYTANPLWSVDPANPSIRSFTGFPMCIPRKKNDPLCPTNNRPQANGKPSTSFTFGDPATLKKNDPNPRVMVPLVVGDYITFSATNVGNGLYAVYALVANVAIFTAPKTLPAYVTCDSVNYAIVDTQGGEIAETRAVVFTTDPTTTIKWSAMDVDPCNGTVTERDLLTALPFTGAPAGRTLFRLGTTNASPPPRNVLFKMSTGTTEGPQGIVAGQFVQPVFNYIFPELINIGRPMLIDSFQTIPYLAQGGGPFVPGNPLTTPPANPSIVGQLNPWPGPGAPAAVTCPGTTAQPPAADPPAAAPPAPGAPPPAGTPKDTVTIVSIVKGLNRNGVTPLSITATSSDTSGNAVLSVTIAGGQNLGPTNMRNDGNGNYFLRISTKRPKTVTITSNEGGSASAPA